MEISIFTFSSSLSSVSYRFSLREDPLLSYPLSLSFLEKSEGWSFINELSTKEGLFDSNPI